MSGLWLAVLYACITCCWTDVTWQSYVDDQLIATKMVQQAAIMGHDGTVWASSTGLTLEPKESKDWIRDFSSTDELAKNGVTVGGTKYMFLSKSDRVVRAKKGTSGVHIIKTVMTYIVGIYQDPVVPEQAATVVEKLGEYLISVGY